ARHHRGRGMGRPGPRLSRSRDRGGGSEPGVGLDRPVLWRAFQPLRQPDPPSGHGRAEGEVPARVDLGRTCRQPCHVGSGRRVGRGGHEAARRCHLGRLCAQRHQVSDYQRDLCRYAGGLCQDRAGIGITRDHRLPDREGLRWLLDRSEDRQDGDARLAHGGAGVQRSLRARRERDGAAARRRGRADVGPRLRARRAGGPPARHHAGVPGYGHPLCPRTQAVRQADRRVPADAGQDRGHVRRAAIGAG
ncbi:hypothetical protein OY671_008800, partial [Metschnikowia pulcherrima]